MPSSRSPSLLSRQTVVPLDRAGHPEPCVPGCLFGTNSVGASHSRPSAVARSTFFSMSDIRSRYYRSLSFFHALASIESGTFYSLLDRTIIVITYTTIITLFIALYMEVEHLASCQGEPMLVDGLDQGLPFPHVVSEDGQHSVQHIDM